MLTPEDAEAGQRSGLPATSLTGGIEGRQSREVGDGGAEKPREDHGPDGSEPPVLHLSPQVLSHAGACPSRRRDYGFPVQSVMVEWRKW